MKVWPRKRIYLDWAAAAPVSPRVLRVFEEAVRTFGNPSSVHEEGRNAKAVLEDARKRIAALLGAKAENTYFVSGATEGNNLAVLGLVRRKMREGVAHPHVLIEEGAHASLASLVSVLEREGVRVEMLSVVQGKLSDKDVLQKLLPDTVLVALQAVNGETGSRHDTRAMKTVLAKADSQAKLLVDASQLPLVESADMTRLGADMLVLDAQKVGGVRGVGVLALQKGIVLDPVLFGGSQERGLRPGTPSPAHASALATALEETKLGAKRFVEQAIPMRDEFVRAITDAVPSAVVHGGKETVPHIISLSFPGLDTDYLQVLLDTEGIATSTKSACETGSVGSRAVLAETGNEEYSTSTLRVSFGPQTRQKDLRYAAQKLLNAVRFLEQSAIT